ncbi:MAG: hypothetical protein AAGJ29_09495 [Pseudomonadota bacterium]
MHTNTKPDFQAKTTIEVQRIKRHRKRLSLAKRPVEQPETPGAHILTKLDVPAYLIADTSKRGEVRSLVLYNENAAAMLARRRSHHPFQTMTKVRVDDKWQRHAGSLPPAPLHRSINAAQAFLLKHSTHWQHDDGIANDRAIKQLQFLDVALPNRCSIGLLSALIHGAHFARAFDAAFQFRPSLNGVVARQASLEELQRAS